MNESNFKAVDPEMILEIAAGIENPVVVAKRYGVEPADYARMAMTPWFAKELDAKRKMLEDDGFTVRAKAAMLAEDLMVDTYRAAKLSESVGAKLDVLKHLSKLGDLEPKPGNHAPVGGGFSITIKLPDNYVGTPDGKIIEHIPHNNVAEMDGEAPKRKFVFRNSEASLPQRPDYIPEILSIETLDTLEPLDEPPDSDDRQDVFSVGGFGSRD